MRYFISHRFRTLRISSVHVLWICSLTADEKFRLRTPLIATSEGHVTYQLTRCQFPDVAATAYPACLSKRRAGDAAIIVLL